MSVMKIMLLSVAIMVVVYWGIRIGVYVVAGSMVLISKLWRRRHRTR